MGTYIVTGSAKTLEGFVAAVAFQFISMLIQKMGTVTELIEAAVNGIKGIISAVLILALAYSLNAISQQLGTAEYVISVTSEWMTPTLLLVFTFLITAFVSFFTGTSWGTYAITTPIVIPLALELTGVKYQLVYAAIAAILGGDVLEITVLLSDTILSSLAAVLTI